MCIKNGLKIRFQWSDERLKTQVTLFLRSHPVQSLESFCNTYNDDSSVQENENPPHHALIRKQDASIDEDAVGPDIVPRVTTEVPGAAFIKVLVRQ